MNNSVMNENVSDNKALAQAYAGYARVRTNYVAALQEKGLAFAEATDQGDPAASLSQGGVYRSEKKQAALARLAARGAHIRNGGASVSYGFLSPACVACTGEGGSETFSTTYKCHRDCYFCFNRNQPDYKKYFEGGIPWESLLERSKEENETLAAVGLTGGEPLLDFDESIALLTRAHELFPNAHTRLYTAGDLLTEEKAQALASVGLDEIRFSLKDDDAPALQRKVFDAIRLAKRYIPSVMVEMPIVPGSAERMQKILLELDEIGIDGINMLEFCFPFCYWDEFEKRGFALKDPPFDVMYDYGYSGGLAVAGSEEEILSLMEWAIDQKLSLGLHYCSLDNKHRSEIRIKNERFAKMPSMFTFDEDDFFLKVGKVFGSDVAPVRRILEERGCQDVREDEHEASLAFPLSYLDEVRTAINEEGSPVRPQICYYVYECESDGAYLIDVALEDAQEQL